MHGLFHPDRPLRRPVVRLAGLVVLTSLGLAGCSTSGRNATPGVPGSDEDTGSAVVVLEPAQGRVVAVNPNLKFVVLDFPLRRMPSLDDRLSVFRGGERVGRVKIMGPFRETQVAADIVSGTVEVGDEVGSDE